MVQARPDSFGQRLGYSEPADCPLGAMVSTFWPRAMLTKKIDGWPLNFLICVQFLTEIKK